MTTDANCLICGEGQLTEKVMYESIEFKGKKFNAPAHYSTCNICGDQANAAQTRLNKRAVIAFKKEVDGLLSGAEIKKIRTQLGLSQADAAAKFGGGPVAFSKYENDDIIQSRAMDNQLRAKLKELNECKPDPSIDWTEVISRTIFSYPRIRKVHEFSNASGGRNNNWAPI